MKTPAFWSPAKATIPQEASQALPLVIGRTIWENSPILLVIDLALAIAALPVVFVAGFGGLIVAPLLLAVTVGPVGLAALAAANALLDGEAVSIGRFAGFVRGSVAPGSRLAMIPGGIASLLIGTLTLAGDEHRRWMLAPVIVDGLVLSGLLISGIGAAWLAAQGAAVDRNLLRRGALIAGSAPQAIGAVVAAAVLIAISVQVIGPLIAIVLAAPFSVFVSATMRWTVEHRRIDLDA
jgi:hypothetical protein